MPLISTSKKITLGAVAIAAGLGLSACSGSGGSGGIGGIFGHRMTLDEAKADTLQFAREQQAKGGPNAMVLISAFGACDAEKVEGITDINTTTGEQAQAMWRDTAEISQHVLDQLGEEATLKIASTEATPAAQQLADEFRATKDWTNCQLLEKLKAVS